MKPSVNIDQDRKAKYKVRVSLAAAILFFIGGFAVLIVGAVRQGRREPINDGLMMALFMGCMLLALVPCGLSWKDALRLETEKQTARYRDLPLGHLWGVGSSQVLEAVRDNGFQKVEDGYLHKQISTFGKGPICCYIRCVPTVTVADSLFSELQRMDRMMEENGREQAKKSDCLYLFLCKNSVTEGDKQSLREAAEGFLLRETVVPVSVFHTCLPVLVDEDTGEGWFLDMTKGISVYAYACRAIKKLFPGK